jgi:stage III sporulation protein AH
MLLKKQTVWLLTMLSLVVVLSVYYITSPEQKSNELAGVEEKVKNEQDQAATKTETEELDTDSIISEAAGDEEFEALRLKLEEQRSEMKEELSAVVATTDLPADERSEAMDQMKKLNQTAQTEQMLETLIRASGYEDALVRADGDRVMITVKSNKEHSKAAANEIIKKVKKEIGSTNYVAVEFQPAK